MGETLRTKAKGHEMTPAGGAPQRWTRNKPTEPGWYWWRFNKHSKAHTTFIEQGNGSDNSGYWYARENSYVPSNACYMKDGEWAGPLEPPD